MSVNPLLLKLAQQQVWRDVAGTIKQAFQPPEPPPQPMPDPMAAGGMPPGGAPAGMPPGGAPAGMPPGMPMDPAMAGGMPPGAAAPPMGPPPAAMPGQQPGMTPAQNGGQMPGQKIKPEQYMQMLDFRLHNTQQQLTALLNALNVQIPAGALITPPGTIAPQPEAALPGGPSDPGQAGGQQGGDSAIQPIQPIDGASPQLAQGGQQKAAQLLPREAEEFLKEARANAPAGWDVILIKAATPVAAASDAAAAAAADAAVSQRTTSAMDFIDQALFNTKRASVTDANAPYVNAAAVSALLRSRANHVGAT